MVNEAVAELKGEEPREPAVELDLPLRRPPTRLAGRPAASTTEEEEEEGPLWPGGRAL